MKNDLSFLARVLFQFHVTRRLYESLFVQVQGQNEKESRMHVLGYVLGLLYYICASLSLVNKNNIDNNNGAVTTTAYDLVRIVTASLLFFYANYKQNECHNQLANARKRHSNTNNKTTKTTNKNSYKQINEGLFKLVACPHYFFEIVIYFAICLLLNFSELSVYMLVAVFANLSVAAQHNLLWYKENISRFPKQRKSMIPFVF